ncbi:hypothetical protein [Lacrimispora sp.]|uniref:hypothetical protein n=1 Tax=Lacrimispora sp. TaxID=2719234 RepID=UPI0039935703
MQQEYRVKADVTSSLLLKNGFKPDKDKFSSSSYLYRRFIKVRFTIDLKERVMHWTIQDSTGISSYFAFSNQKYHENSRIALRVINEFNLLIKRYEEAEIIEEEL